MTDPVLRSQPGSRKVIAKAIYASWLDADFCTENHFQWFDAGKDNPDSCVHYSNVAKALNAADAVLAALPPPEAAGGREEIERLREALQFIADSYDNHDVNHVDYRVKVYQVALEALAHSSTEGK